MATPSQYLMCDDMRKRILLMMSSLFCAILLFAQHRDVAKALSIAADVLSVSEKEMLEIDLSEKLSNKLYFSSSLHEDAFYVFNHIEKNAFVIVSSDIRMKDVLGYSEHTRFNNETIPCGLNSLLSYYAEQYSYLQEADGKYVEKENIAPETTEIKENVPPILASEWGQESPYNDNCPVGCPCGCVATAMGQIMRYYAYPETGEGYFSYVTETNKYKRSYNFSEAHFKWSLMKDKYNSTYEPTSRSAVANLLEACGVAVGMDYARNGSGALDTDVPYALIHFFKYNKNIVRYSRPYYKSSEWYELLYTELKEGRPVLYCGQDVGTQGGHAFIINGYRKSDGKFYINWGWDGDYDGYYELDALNPRNYRFSSSQSMIAKFYPEAIGDSEDIFYAERFSHSNKIEIDKNLIFKLSGVYNFSNSSSYAVQNSSFTGYIGVGLYNSDLEFICSLAEKEIKNVRTYSGFSEIPFTFTIPSDIIVDDETYNIVPYVKSKSNTKPTRIRTLGGITDLYTFKKNESENETPVDENVIEVLVEGFDSSDIPIGWTQEHVSGEGIWAVKRVLVENETDRTPTPALGRGYTFLSYNSGTSFADRRTVTKLVTPKLIGGEGRQYSLEMQCRKFSEKVGTSEIIAVLIDRDNDGTWEILSEQSVMNSNNWMTMKIPYMISGNYRLAIEGSIEYGGTIFVDDLKITMNEMMSHVEDIDSIELIPKIQIYTPTGIYVTPEIMRSHPGIYIYNGKKIFIK